VLDHIDPAGDAPQRMAWAAGSLWITGRGTDLLQVDPAAVGRRPAHTRRRSRYAASRVSGKEMQKKITSTIA
jgi:hypothetical protein